MAGKITPSSEGSQLPRVEQDNQQRPLSGPQKAISTKTEATTEINVTKRPKTPEEKEETAFGKEMFPKGD